MASSDGASGGDGGSVHDWATFDAAAFRESYFREGYAVIRGVFPPSDVAVLRERFDAWRSEMLERHESTFVKGNHRVWVGAAGSVGGGGSAKRVLRGVQWPSYEDPVLDKFRTDARLFPIVSALLGPDVKQIINQMHWKQPGSLTQWRYHQDVRARKPEAAFRELWSSYINLGVAVERCTDETGAMRVLPRSHLAKRDLGIEAVAEEMGVDAHPPSDAELAELLRRVGADPAQLRTLELAPGDVGVWNPFAIHGGGLNTSKDCHRSFYIQGFGAAAHTDRGHVAWLAGVPQPLGEPVLIQLDNYKETLAEGGRYYPFAGDGGSRQDRQLELEKQEREKEARAMNLVRD
jgi:ectoine hydroxylase-related dioxygenase (phytanoyl-CoA dioxygenase family)